MSQNTIFCRNFKEFTHRTARMYKHWTKMLGDVPQVEVILTPKANNLMRKAQARAITEVQTDTLTTTPTPPPPTTTTTTTTITKQSNKKGTPKNKGGHFSLLPESYLQTYSLNDLQKLNLLVQFPNFHQRSFEHDSQKITKESLSSLSFPHYRHLDTIHSIQSRLLFPNNRFIHILLATKSFQDVFGEQAGESNWSVWRRMPVPHTSFSVNISHCLVFKPKLFDRKHRDDTPSLIEVRFHSVPKLQEEDETGERSLMNRASLLADAAHSFIRLSTSDKLKVHEDDGENEEAQQHNNNNILNTTNLQNMSQTISVLLHPNTSSKQAELTHPVSLNWRWSLGGQDAGGSGFVLSKHPMRAAQTIRILPRMKDTVSSSSSSDLNDVIKPNFNFENSDEMINALKNAQHICKQFDIFF